MLKLGYNTNGFAHHRLEDAIILLGEMGYRSVAITLDYHSLDPYSDSLQSQAKRVGELLDQFQMGSVIETGARFLLDFHRKHYPTLISDPEGSEKRFDFLRKSIAIGKILGSTSVSFWSGAPDPSRSRKQSMDQLIHYCKNLAMEAEESGIRLAFEPEPGMLIDTMDAFRELHEGVNHPFFGLTLDIGHLQCMGETPIPPFLHEWKDWLWNIHIEDMRRGIHDHLLFGEGEIDFAPVFQTLQKIRYSGGIHVELSRHSHNAVETAKKSLEFMNQFLRGS